MSTYTISIMKKEQESETKELMQRCFDKSLASIFFLHPDTTLVVLYEGRVVAGLNLDVYRVNDQVNMGYLGWLYTDEKHRGKGLAGKLISESLPFLKSLGCTDVAACVEGDNPASFKQLENEGFSRLPLVGQIRRFRFGLFRVWKHASRFFDMGYFMWHLHLSDATRQGYPENCKAFVLGAVANTLLFLPVLLGWNLLSLLNLSWMQVSHPNKSLLVAIPLLSLLVRTVPSLVFAHARKIQLVYRQWDTAYFTALLLPFLAGLPFPVPGNLYIQGSNWSMKTHARSLARMSLVSNTSLALLFILLPNPYTLFLLTLDTFFFFYPFCGFNASRIMREGWNYRTYGIILTLACYAFLLVY